ncbi:hypothetical protein PF005_g28989 [Phytophthora fragariae]|uniref:Uncharacterized protein n=1 Tax=Phytophthora fragariae TaxID=53985 RepID=A0A6A3W5B2_9STRA|nr:hypothetical protein PF005_g28989 [Phytophthora fragariae]KAE9177503.1 hypothetical protein PF002_g28322 [Phytophthora fragariae]
MSTQDKAAGLLQLLQLRCLELLRRDEAPCGTCLAGQWPAPATPAEDKAKVLSGTVETRKPRVQVIKGGPRLVNRACPYPSHKEVKVLDFKHKGTVEGTISQDKEVDYQIKDKVGIKALAGDSLIRASVNTNKCHLGRQGNRLGGPTGSKECKLHKPLSYPAACRSRRDSSNYWANPR